MPVSRVGGVCVVVGLCGECGVWWGGGEAARRQGGGKVYGWEGGSPVLAIMRKGGGPPVNRATPHAPAPPPSRALCDNERATRSPRARLVPPWAPPLRSPADLPVGADMLKEMLRRLAAALVAVLGVPDLRLCPERVVEVWFRPPSPLPGGDRERREVLHRRVHWVSTRAVSTPSKSGEVHGKYTVAEVLV